VPVWLGQCASELRAIPGACPRSAQRGDPIETENCYQHAEHYFGVINNRALTCRKQFKYSLANMQIGSSGKKVAASSGTIQQKVRRRLSAPSWRASAELNWSSLITAEMRGAERARPKAGSRNYLVDDSPQQSLSASKLLRPMGLLDRNCSSALARTELSNIAQCCSQRSVSDIQRTARASSGPGEGS